MERRAVMAKRARKKRVDEDLGRKLLGYSIAAGAALAVGTNADARLVKTYIGQTATPGNSVMIDLDGDGNTDFVVSVTSTEGTAFNAFISGRTVEHDGLGIQAVGVVNQIAVAEGFLVQPFFTSNYVGPAANFVGFAAFSKTNANFFAGLQQFNSYNNFGGALVNVGPGHSFVTVVSTVFETEPGVSAHLEPIPEPGTLALLATGAAGLMALRRRQRRTEAETESSS
jgi:hypothetical protein